MSLMNVSFVSSQNYPDFQFSLSGGRRIFLEIVVNLASKGTRQYYTANMLIGIGAESSTGKSKSVVWTT